MASPYYIYCPGHQKESGHRRNFFAAMADPSCHADWFERKIPGECRARPWVLVSKAFPEITAETLIH